MTFTEALSAAKDTRDAEEFITRVKNAVSNELAELDPSIEIEDTRYFNHSAIPDLVIKWPREKSERAVFLRHSYQSVVDADDIAYLENQAPVLMSINTHEAEDNDVERNLEQATSATRLLATDPAAFDTITAQADGRTPITDLVRANFVRGGRGLIDRTRAKSLIAVPNAETPVEQREQLITQSFTEDAAARITRTVQLIDLALSEDFATFNREESPLVGGKLSMAELKHLVPWLLQHPQAADNHAFWVHLGEYVSFADLENIRQDLVDLDLTPLIHANAKRWSAKRAYVGLSVPAEHDGTHEKRFDCWSFRDGSALGIDLGEQRLSLAVDKRLLRGRTGSSTASWEQIENAVAHERLARIDLRGITRSVILTAEKSPDIRADVQQVANSLDDSYLVSELTIRTPAPSADGTVDVEVSFDTGITASDSGAALADLSRIALQVMTFKAPASDQTVQLALGPASPSRKMLGT